MASGPISSVQFISVAQLCPTLCDPMNCSMPGLPVHHQLPEFTQTHIHRVGDAIQQSHPLSSPSPPAHNPSQHQSLFQWVNSSHEVAKVTEVSALASFLPKISQGWSPCSPRDSQESSPTPQFKIINSSALSLHSPSLTSIRNHGKTIALTRRTFVDKVMPLLFNMLSRLVKTFTPRSKPLLISWLQSPSAVILEPKKIKSDTVSPSISHEVMGPDAVIFVFWMLSFNQFCYSPIHFHQEALEFLFTFCHKGGVICISEVIEISPGNLDSSLCFLQSSVSHDVLCIEVK